MRHVVGPAEDWARLDDVLAAWLPGELRRPFSRSLVRRLVMAGAVRVGTERVELAPGQVAWLDRPTGQGESVLRLEGGGAGGRAILYAGENATDAENLAKLQRLCPSGCTQLAELSAAITRGPTVAAAKPVVTPKSN